MNDKILLYKNNLNYHLVNNNVNKITKYIYKINTLTPKPINQNGGHNTITVYSYKYKDIMTMPIELWFKFKDDYMFISTGKSNELISKNVDAIEDAMKEHDPTGKALYHMSRNPIDKIADTTFDGSYSNLSVYYNPNGLWFSCGAEWLKYTKRYNLDNWNTRTYLYEVIISDNVLQINNLKEFKKFIDEYKNTGDDFRFDNVINWERVRKDYYGLLICPYLGDEIWGDNANDFTLYGNTKLVNNYIMTLVGDNWKNSLYLLAEWYRHWETATGVVWNPKGIKKINLVKRMTTFEVLENKK